MTSIDIGLIILALYLFLCKACGNGHDTAVVVCSYCEKTQLGQAVRVAATLKGLYEEQIDALEWILTEAQNGPPEGASDGSITERRWRKLRALATAAKAYNDALTWAMEP